MINTYGQYLALTIAEQLNDKKHLGFYLKLAKKYNPDDIFLVLSIVNDVCRRQKVKNKAALFTKLFFDYIDEKI